jgi:hypothetical protein
MPAGGTEVKAKHATSWWHAGVSAAVLTVLASIAVVGVWVLHEFGPSVVKDKATYEHRHELLVSTGRDLDTVPTPSHARPAKRSEYTGCGGEDSGEIFQPAMWREWPLLKDARRPESEFELRTSKGAREAARSIVEDLRARGWVGKSTLDEYAATTLHGTGDRAEIYISVQAFEDSVLAYASSSSRKRVCGRIL